MNQFSSIFGQPSRIPEVRILLCCEGDTERERGKGVYLLEPVRRHALLPIGPGPITAGDHRRSLKLPREAQAPGHRFHPFAIHARLCEREASMAAYEKVFYQLLYKCRAIAPKEVPLRQALQPGRLRDRPLRLPFRLGHLPSDEGGGELHLLLDHDGYLPVFAHITEGSVHEVTIAQGLSSREDPSWCATGPIRIMPSLPAGRTKESFS